MRLRPFIFVRLIHQAQYNFWEPLFAKLKIAQKCRSHLDYSHNGSSSSNPHVGWSGLYSGKRLISNIDSRFQTRRRIEHKDPFVHPCVLSFSLTFRANKTVFSFPFPILWRLQTTQFRFRTFQWAGKLATSLIGTNVAFSRSTLWRHGRYDIMIAR